MYEIVLGKTAEDDLKRLPKDVYRRTAIKLRSLSDNPRPPGCRKIAGSANDWRQRIGDYRIIYEIDDAALKVLVYRIKHRRDVYR